MPIDEPAPGTRERLVAAMADALQRRGLHGVGLNELLLQAQAPKGVLYHHFPGGKTQLAVAAIDAVVARLGASLAQLRKHKPDTVSALRSWLSGALKLLEQSGFERGCPLATVALETGPEDTAIRRALAGAFAGLREQLAQVLAGAGLTEPKARGLATLIVAAYEGALMQARVAGDAEPMRQTADALLGLVERELQDAQRS
ncbi:MAG: TetR/AcrR family transcriptional regulator [Chitinophagaceae bacterium]|nr:TetR/AcrR family transcriptional regulator [Rubrivivax sp.]